MGRRIATKGNWARAPIALALGAELTPGSRAAGPRGVGMVRIVLLSLTLIVVGIDAGLAQDIAGIEDCTKTSGLDKRTGCLQSNVNFLQRLVTKNALAADTEIAALKRAVTSLQKTVEQLQAAQKATGNKKPEIK
jgi:hypothetical protein